MSRINSWSPFLSESVPFCSCPPETSDTALVSTDELDGNIFFFEIHVDPDIPFCPACELAQLDLSVLYSCHCSEVL